MVCLSGVGSLSNNIAVFADLQACKHCASASLSSAGNRAGLDDLAPPSCPCLPLVTLGQVCNSSKSGCSTLARI